MWTKIKPELFYLSLGLNFAFVTILIFTLLPTGFFSGEPEHERKSHMYRFYHHQLNVNDTQWEEIQPRLRALHKKRNSACQELANFRIQLIHEIKQEIPDTNTISSLKNEIDRIRSIRESALVEHVKAQKQTLTETQNEKYFERLEKMAECRNQRGHSYKKNGSKKRTK